MKLTNEIQTIIDNMYYEAMLYRWRFSDPGDEIFQGDSGEYFIDSMFLKESKLAPGEKATISKKIGWEK